jgi:hypothetical protein
VLEEQMDGGSSCSALRLRSKNDVAHVKADFFSVEFTADFWYLSVVTGANEHQSRPPTKSICVGRAKAMISRLT